MAVCAMLVFVNSATANINGFPSGDQFIIKRHNIRTSPIIYALARDNAFNNVAIRDIVKCAFRSRVFRIRPKQAIRASAANVLPYCDIFIAEKVACGVNAANVDIIGLNLRQDSAFYKVGKMTGKNCFPGKAFFRAIEFIAAVAGIAAGASTRASPLFRLGNTVFPVCDILICRQYRPGINALAQLSIAVD